jgi:hypothetical protein
MNGFVRQNVEAKNERVRAGFKPAPTGKCPHSRQGLENPGYRAIGSVGITWAGKKSHLNYYSGNET